MIIVAPLILAASMQAPSSDCGLYVYADLLRKTESLVERAQKLKIPLPPVKGFGKGACVRLEFSISSEGHAKNIEIVQTSGSRALDVSALNALQHYCFRSPPPGHENDRYMLVFRAVVY